MHVRNVVRLGTMYLIFSKIEQELELREKCGTSDQSFDQSSKDNDMSVANSKTKYPLFRNLKNKNKVQDDILRKDEA